MKILYAIQGTGNGHLSRAREIIPILQNFAEVDILVSGTQADVQIPYEIKFRMKGMSFIFGKKGGIDLPATYLQLSTREMMKDIASLPVQDYDLVLNDFEPVSAWACRQHKIPCISLSHQCAVLNRKAPKPKQKDFVGKVVLRYYAPCTSSYGFHFDRYDKNIFTPVIRSEVRNLEVKNKGHYTVYLPAYSDEIMIQLLNQITHINWQVFSKQAKRAYTNGNVFIQPIQNELFLESMASCKGVLCGAGFETPAEALYLKKKLAVIPMKTQYEQQCNAAALKEMGVTIFKSLKEKHLGKIMDWVDNNKIINVHYPDVTERIIRKIIKKHTTNNILSEEEVPMDLNKILFD